MGGKRRSPRTKTLKADSWLTRGRQSVCTECRSGRTGCPCRPVPGAGDGGRWRAARAQCSRRSRPSFSSPLPTTPLLYPPPSLPPSLVAPPPFPLPRPLYWCCTCLALHPSSPSLLTFLPSFLALAACRWLPGRTYSDVRH